MYCFNFCHHIFPSIVWFCTIRKKAIHWHSIKKTKLMYEITTRCFLRILIKFLFFDPEWWHQNREMSLFFDCRIRHLTKTKVCTHNQNSMFLKKYIWWPSINCAQKLASASGCCSTKKNKISQKSEINFKKFGYHYLIWLSIKTWTNWSTICDR